MCFERGIPVAVVRQRSEIAAMRTRLAKKETRYRFMAFVACLLIGAGCGHQPAPQPGPAPRVNPATAGGRGDICACGRNRSGESDCTEVVCGPGLVCGYGCGVPGCDGVCMTPEESEAAGNIP